MFTLGIDIGSTSTKAVILRDGKDIVATSVVDVGAGTSGARRVLSDIFEKTGLSLEEMGRTIATGYGRLKFEHSDSQISELSCHSKGVSFLLPGIHTIIDIGGQDAKALKLNERGAMVNFVMNEKCAAGTGRFLDVMATVLETKVSELGRLSEQATGEINISSTCTVFAESEVISYLADNIRIPDIIAGIHKSVAKRVSALARRVGLNPNIAMTGGVAQNSGVVKAMEKEIHEKIYVPPMPQLTGALGAAILAYEEMEGILSGPPELTILS